MNAPSYLPVILTIALILVLISSCSKAIAVETTLLPKTNASIFVSDAHLAVLGDTYNQYLNCNPQSDEIADFAAGFFTSKAYEASFLATKRAEEHIIWSLGEIVEAEGTMLLIAPVININKKKLTKTVFISREDKYGSTKYTAAIEQLKNKNKNINDYFGVKAFHLSLGKDEHLDRHLVLTFPAALKNDRAKYMTSDTIQIQIANVADTWHRDYESYLKRDYSASSYLGKTVTHVYGNYVYRYDSGGFLTYIRIPVDERIAIFNTD